MTDQEYNELLEKEFQLREELEILRLKNFILVSNFKKKLDEESGYNAILKEIKELVKKFNDRNNP